MASSINADNGVVSGSSGLKSTADTSGVLALQSNGSTGVTLNTDLSVTFAGAQTLSAGTANGVTYLNGSKVLTSGSALTFDGTTTFLLNASAASSQANFRVQTDTTGAVANGYFNINGTDYFRIYTTSSETGLRNLQNTPIYFSVNNTEQMRLTSTGLGIGTSSPSYKLDVVSSGDAARFGNTKKLYVSTDSNGFGLLTGGAQTGSGFYVNDTSAYSSIWTGGSERFRIASSGQLGIGGANYGTSGQVLTSGGSGAAPTWSTPAGGFSAMTVITSSTTFTIPSGKTTLKVTVVGGGGGGGGDSGYGGTGGSTTLASGTQTISTITGNGGAGGDPAGTSWGGSGGSSSGGDVNAYGNGGGSGGGGTGYLASGFGGGSILGGGARATGGYSSGVAGTSYGGGGAGCSRGGGQTSAAGGGGGGGAIKYLTGLTPGNTLTVTIGNGGTGGSGSYSGGTGGAGVVIIEY